MDPPSLRLDQVQAAMAAMLEAASERPNEPLAIAIVDDSGDIVDFARMDNCRKFPQKMAFNKAYTCAMFGADSDALIESLKNQGWSTSDFGDPKLNAIPGGVVIRQPTDGAILGAIGVSGYPSGEDDASIARIGIKALNL